MPKYNVGDLVICDMDQDTYIYLGAGSWDGWGNFMKICDGSTNQMVLNMFSKY